MLTDSSCLFNMVLRSSSTAERGLMVYFTAVQEAYNKMEIYDISWIFTLKYIADAFTKISVNKLLDKLKKDNTPAQTIAQWVNRDKELLMKRLSNKKLHDLSDQIFDAI